MKKGRVWKEFEKEFGNPAWVLLGLLAAFLLPGIILYEHIQFLPEVFVTEWMKAFAETVLLLVAARFILITREKRKSMIEDSEELEQQVGSFISLAREKLGSTSTASTDKKIAAYREARLCWLQVAKYLNNAQYLSLRSKPLILELIKLVHSQELDQRVEQLNQFFQREGDFDVGKVELSLSALDFLNAQLLTLSGNGNTTSSS